MNRILLLIGLLAVGLGVTTALVFREQSKTASQIEEAMPSSKADRAPRPLAPSAGRSEEEVVLLTLRSEPRGGMTIAYGEGLRAQSRPCDPERREEIVKWIRGLAAPAREVELQMNSFGDPKSTALAMDMLTEAVGDRLKVAVHASRPR